MGDHAPGWRSRRVAYETGVPVATPRSAARVRVVPAHAVGDAASGVPPWRHVRPSLLYLGFLTYLIIAATSRVRGGDIAMAVALFGLVLEPNGVRLPRCLLWFGAFALWSAIGIPLSDFPDVVSDRVVEVGKLWLIALAAASALTTRARIQWFIVVFLASFALFPLRGAFLNYLGGYTMYGRAIWNHIYANPNDLAALTLLQLSMVAGLLSGGARGWLRWAAIAGAALLPLLILATQSRGAFIALGVFAVALLVEQRRHLTRGNVLKLAVLAAGLAFFAPAGVWERVGGLKHATSSEQLAEADAEGSARQRFEIWKVAAKIIREHPMTGVGLGAYGYAHGIAAQSDEFDRTARGRRDTHSTYLSVMAETGVVGFALFVGLFAGTVVFAERVRRRAASILPHAARQLLYLELGLLAFFVAGIWGSYAHLAFTYLHLVLIWSMADLCRREMQARSVGDRMPAGAGGR